MLFKTIKTHPVSTTFIRHISGGDFSFLRIQKKMFGIIYVNNYIKAEKILDNKTFHLYNAPDGTNETPEKSDLDSQIGQII